MRRILILALLAAAVAQPARATVQRAFDCAGAAGATAAMENSYMTAVGAGPCWAHLGHHTYALGGRFAVGAVTGRLFSVELQLSPPVEYVDPNNAAILFEASIDGRAWSVLHRIPWPFVYGNNAILPGRQGVTFAFDADGAMAQYLRIRQPLSAAQGLSGYIDSSSFEATMTPAGIEQPAWAGTRAFGCASDVMEGVYPGHPCWFGGIDRYDAASFFHTYDLDVPVDVERIEGHVTLLPWRTDDYNIGGSRTAIRAIIQTSTDGITFADRATVAGTYGNRITFSWQDLSVSARLIRIVAERHAFFNDPSEPSLKHARGFIVDSALLVTAA